MENKKKIRCGMKTYFYQFISNGCDQFKLVVIFQNDFVFVNVFLERAIHHFLYDIQKL